jgi:hypothetical protein
LEFKESLIRVINNKFQNGRNREFLIRELVGEFLHGQCYELSLAIQKSTGYPIFGLINRGGTIWHTAVKLPNGKYLDARGELDEADLANFPGLDFNYLLKEVSKEDLYNQRDVNGTIINERGVRKAERLILALYPNFSENSLEKRVLNFMNDLQRLSEQHGLWIRSAFPAAPPFFAETHDDENPYYAARHSDDGIAICFDRKFK